LPEPAGGGARAGADRRLPRRARRHEDGARPHRLRPVPVPLDGGVDPHPDEAQVAEEVFLADACRDTLKTLGYKTPEVTSMKHTFALGRTRVFDPDKPDDYLKSFPIRKV